jgi:transposase
VNTSITYVGMDTHKKEHRVAVLFPGQEELLEMTVPNRAGDIRKAVQKIQKQSTGPVHFCYEAGVCGFDLQRRIEAMGCQCAVIAPSLTPCKPGERVKTDRRDAKKLLMLSKNGLLTEVYPPNAEQEAAREITRQREAALNNLQRIRHRIDKFLTRHGYIYAEGLQWTTKHATWLHSIRPDNPLLYEVYRHYLEDLEYCQRRLKTCDQAVEALAQSEPYRQVVGLLCCFHGINTLTAISILTEIFDFGRFASPRELMSYLGLTPSEQSSGTKQHKGGICKTGNRRVRRLLNETSWHYRYPYKAGKVLRRRQRTMPEWAIALATRAGHRLSKRYYRLIQKGKMPCQAVIAVARELAGFIWAMVREYTAHHSSQVAK